MKCIVQHNMHSMESVNIQHKSYPDLHKIFVGPAALCYAYATRFMRRA